MGWMRGAWRRAAGSYWVTPTSRPVKTSHTPTRPPPTETRRMPSGLHAHEVTAPGRLSCLSSVHVSQPAAIVWTAQPGSSLAPHQEHKGVRFAQRFAQASAASYDTDGIFTPLGIFMTPIPRKDGTGDVALQWPYTSKPSNKGLKRVGGDAV